MLCSLALAFSTYSSLLMTIFYFTCRNVLLIGCILGLYANNVSNNTISHIRDSKFCHVYFLEDGYGDQNNETNKDKV